MVVLNSFWRVIVGISFLRDSEKNISLQLRAFIILNICSFLMQTKFFLGVINLGQCAVKY